MRRPVALAVGGAAALIIAGLLIAPIVLLTGGSSTKPCAQTLRYGNHTYVARSVAGAVQRIATGVGVVSGCDQPAANVDVRSLTRISPARALGVAGDSSSVYVRRGLCTSAPAAELLACLRSG